MEKYFELFSSLLELLKGNLEIESEVDETSLQNIIGEMRSLASKDPRLNGQQAQVDFYERTVSSFFKKGMAKGYKMSFYDSLLREKEGLEQFAKDNRLFK